MSIYLNSDVRLLTTRQESIDTTQPPITDKARSNYIEGQPVLQADPIIDYSATDAKLALSTHLSIERQLAASDSIELEPTCQPLTESTLINHIRAYTNHTRTHEPLTRTAFSTAFDPISEAPLSGLSHSSAALTASSFDRPFSILTTDLAPYVRSIAAHDLRLEEQRVRLSGLLSEGGRGNGKRVRTTRAARSALEGGKRENTRRERWFGKELNLALVLRTGGKEWAGAVGGVREGDGVAGSAAGSADEGSAADRQLDAE